MTSISPRSSQSTPLTQRRKFSRSRGSSRRNRATSCHCSGDTAMEGCPVLMATSTSAPSQASLTVSAINSGVMQVLGFESSVFRSSRAGERLLLGLHIRRLGDGLMLDLVLEPHDALDERLRPGRAAGDINIHRHDQV